MIQAVQYGLTGIALTPPGVSASKADNLVWLLGKYVERDCSGDRPYLIS